MRTLLATAVASLVFSAPFAGAGEQAAGYKLNPQAQSFIDTLVKEENFERKELEAWFAQAQKQQSILDAIARPAEKTKTWAEYQDIFLTSSRLEKGVEFWKANRETLQRAEEQYGVPPQIIVAIIGVETRYGAHKGGYRVMDALSTLAFDYPPRSPFFTKELRQFLLLAREQQRDPLTLKGSYAGAMGYGQFMPSSYRAYATDFDGDGFVDIWENTEDAIGSVANYFVRHGWQQGESVVHRARVNGDYDTEVLNDSLKPLHTVGKLKAKGFTPLDKLPADASASAIKLEGKQGAEFWIGLQNFYAITRYNHSRLYAMAVYQLSEQLREAMDQQAVARQ
ncbi:lytic murein transglycosylase B [Pseudomaricurvus sp. HS19]|uniref:lytic murein transglycosylase B n=1 Tax=Pseudomaricurvus sp. HS19 TaxID=2692626 RepID=UPI00136EAD41|nr:lytic murein transglycosylase B [Pseudomaricurvus sp. HS19]MYM63239.1 lytic murein transglycosylase B [Pseudomaricurvus sp. HS19]